MEPRGWWVVVVTAWRGPDEEHPLIVRLTLSTKGRQESKALPSPEEACAQLETWLHQLTATDVDATAT